LIIVLQFREDVSDLPAADALRARIDWIYLLGLELADPGLDDCDLCEFRSRLITTRTPPDREQRPFLA
jgi:transposase